MQTQNSQPNNIRIAPTQQLNQQQHQIISSNLSGHQIQQPQQQQQHTLQYQQQLQQQQLQQQKQQGQIVVTTTSGGQIQQTNQPGVGGMAANGTRILNSQQFTNSNTMG